MVATLLPFVTFIVTLGIRHKITRGGTVAIFNSALSLLISVFVFCHIWNVGEVHSQIKWFTIGTFTLHVGVLLNNLSVVMMVLVSGIALLVHIYSTRYMEGDPYLRRYWAYLGLFCFAMLGLVMMDNLLLMYVAWELVGFASYLLIGFWFTRQRAVKANLKAFIMNRIGDIAFLIGIMIVLTQFGTLDLQSLFGDQGLVGQAVVKNGFWISGRHVMGAEWLTIAGLAFFIGAVAKSAQFPLHTWLPDAMEGPTSVSSLIHAATMVAAGVFLLARINPLFNESVLSVIAVIGAFTAFMAGTIALVQNDIKKILAFSTISQLGFMFLAVGVGAQSVAIFHLVTHAFFKCLLFLAAGAIIHEMAHLRDTNNLKFDPQDIRLMGGLRKKMPVTFIAMLVASMALVGIPLTSGYLSKDAILIQAFEWSEDKHGLAKLIPYSALVTSWLTAFYIGRLLFKVFFGELRLQKIFDRNFSVHEASMAMRVPLVILAGFCLFPLFSLNPVLFEDAWILKGLPVTDTLSRVNAYHTVVPAGVNLVALFVIYVSFRWYVQERKMPDFQRYFFFRFAARQWFIDVAYSGILVNGVIKFSEKVYEFDRTVVDGIVLLAGKAGVLLSAISAGVDKYLIDGAVNALGSAAVAIGRFFRVSQSGRLQQYFVTMLLAILTFFILKYYTAGI